MFYSLVPPPRANLVTYHGVLAPERARRYRWAELLKRVFSIDGLQCSYCQGRRKLIAFITETPVIRAILQCLDLPSEPPVLSPARWPP